MNNKMKTSDFENLRKEMDIPFTSTYHIEKEVEKLDLNREEKNLLKSIEGYIVLAKKNDGPRDSFNIYIKGAERASGIYRVCYMRIAENNIELKEYKGARGDRFSAYYLILEEIMNSGGVKSQADGNYSIRDLELIIQCINRVNSFAEEKEYSLRNTGKTYPRIYKGETYKLPILYYVKEEKKELDEEKTQEVRLSEIGKELEALYRKCTSGTTDECFKICDGLEDVKRWIDKMFEVKEIRANWEIK